MKETMGQIIKRLRKERNLTQEELAEQLGVTFQAVSKWENDNGMPDISQVVPLATVFNVSTDVLFGIYGTSDAEEVDKIIKEAYSKITYPATRECIRECYDILQKGLVNYPNNTLLLSQCLEKGISLAYPDNDVYDPENGEAIYKECIREANIVIKYSKSTTDVLRAHMIMVLLHSAYGNFDAAKTHANEFPWRADMTIHEMNAYISHFEKDYYAEGVHCQYDFMYHFEAMLDDIVELGCCYKALGNYEDAHYALSEALALIDLVCKKEDIRPSLHYRERGDIYALLSEVCILEGKTSEAIQLLEKMADHDLAERAKYQDNMRMNTPLLCDVDHNFYWTFENENYGKEQLLRKLNNPAFDRLRNDDRFANLIQKADQL